MAAPALSRFCAGGLPLNRARQQADSVVSHSSRAATGGIRYNGPMTVRSIAAAITATTVGFIFLAPREIAAQGSAVRVLVSNGMKAAMEELKPECERAI